MSTVQAILFDLDGVLTDTAEFHYQAWKHLATDLNVPFDRKRNDLLRGVSRRQSLDLVLNGKEISDSEAEKLMNQKNEYYKKLVATMTPKDIIPGAIELLGYLKEQNIKRAIASVSKNAKTVLHHIALTDYFDFIGDGFVATKSKPDPDIFLACARALAIAPSFCVVVEDAASGIEAAHRAGMGAIGVGNAAISADATIHSVGDVTPVKFVALANIVMNLKGGG